MAAHLPTATKEYSVMSAQLTDLLRDTLHPLVDRLETTGLALRMITGDIDRPQYLELMGQMELIHQRIESAALAHPQIAAIIDPTLLRGQTLQADLLQLNQGVSRTHRPLGATRWLLNLIDRWQEDPTPTLLGALFVLESSRQWNSLLVKPLSEGLGVDPLPGEGIDYHLQAPHDHSARWRAFEERINQLPLDETATILVCQAALDTMIALWQIHDQVADRLTEETAPGRYAPKMIAAL